VWEGRGEAADITRICDGLNINIGTLHKQSIRAMHLAGKRAMELGHALLLDPVGAGASKLRPETAAALMEKLHFTAIRGNISEIKALCLGSTTTKGVDADAADAVTEANLADMIEFAKSCAQSCGSVIAITGAIDLVADAEVCYVIRNGRKEMSSITGTGCQLSGVMTAFLAANPGHALAAAAAAVAAMGLAGGGAADGEVDTDDDSDEESDDDSDDDGARTTLQSSGRAPRPGGPLVPGGPKGHGVGGARPRRASPPSSGV